MTTTMDIAAPETVGLSRTGLARVDAMLSEMIARGELPGADVLIARRGKIVHRSTLGLKKNLARKEPLTDDTIFAIFSMTKPVTAVAMMILHEKGLWSPDDPIAKHLPEFATLKGPDGKAPAHQPTMRELMSHTAGFGYGLAPGAHDATDAAYVEAKIWQADGLVEMMQRLAPIPLAYQPGATFRYSLSMDVQGAIIERLTGETLPDFMRSRIFAPLGMTDTDFFVPEDKRHRLATLYHMYGVPALTELDHPGFRRDGKFIPKIPSGGGGLYSTASDYARFAQMLLGKGARDGVQILKPETVALMTTNVLSDAILNAGIVAGAHAFRPGYGYAFNGAVFHDPVRAGSPVGRGTYQWDGASGVWFWVDPQNDLLFIGMIQRMMQDTMPPLQVLTQKLVAEAFVEPARP